MSKTREERFLLEINRYLPRNIDWKKGAVDYLRNLCTCEGKQNLLYHYIKPFLGGPDFSPFFLERYGFLNMLELIDLPMKAKVLDVACGPGWTSHFLAKLGYQVLGIDISQDFIEIAQQRLRSDPYTVYENVPLAAEFMVHDIEDRPLPVDTRFDAAFFESALHHFYDPVSALQNISLHLTEDGLLCIWEAAAPRRDSPAYQENLRLMEKYHSLERPYTRRQIIELLYLCGFKYYEFYAAVNGLFNPSDPADMRRIKRQLAMHKDWNIVVASRRPNFFESKNRLGTYLPLPVSILLKIKSIFSDLQKISAFLRCHRDNETFLQFLYKEILGRKPDAHGMSHYLERLRLGTSRIALVLAFIASREYLLKRNSKTAPRGLAGRWFSIRR